MEKIYCHLLPLNISLKALLCAVILHVLANTGCSQPQYIQVGTLPVPAAGQRVELFDAQNQIWFSIPTYYNGYQHAVYYCKPGANDAFSWNPTTSNSDQLDFGRTASNGTNLYFNGTYVSASAFAPINGNGSIGAWQETTHFPISTFPGWSLHQEFVFNGRFYILGGWHGDTAPFYPYVYYATIQGDGSMGTFVQTTSLPLGMASHSAIVTAGGKVYVAYSTNLFLAQIAADGSIGGWVTQPPVAGMNHSIETGNDGMALVGDRLVIVDNLNTFVCFLNSSGQLASVAATINNPFDFGPRYVYANNGTIYVTSTTTGQIYRLDGLPTAFPHAATAIAILNNGFVVSNNITDGGYGYTNTPTVRIIGGGGSGAQAVVVVSNGVVTAINVLNAGFGYTNAPLVVIEPPYILNPVLGISAMSFLSFSNLTVGGNYQLQQKWAWYWTNQPVSFTATNSLFTQMVAGVRGSGDFQLALNPVPSQAFATAQMVNGFVVGATVTAGGSGYVTAPAVTISGRGGSHATAVSQISGGTVTNISITDAGIGYTNTPTVEIAPPPAAAVFPTVQPVMRVDCASMAPYDNYQIQLTPGIGGTWGNWNGGLFSPTATTNSQYLFITNRTGFFRLQYVP